MYQDWMKDYNELVFNREKEEHKDNKKDSKESN